MYAFVSSIVNLNKIQVINPVLAFSITQTIQFMRHEQKQMPEEKNSKLEKKLAALTRELDIQASLEKVRVIALEMKIPGDMPDVCRVISQQLEGLGVKEIRNVQTAIFYSEKGTYMNYEFYAKHDKTFITEVSYTDHAIARSFADQMLKGNGEFFITHLKGKEVKDWLNYQRGTNVFIDTWLETATSLNYYWYSLGPVALGISTYAPFNENEIELFKRFRNVFELAYRRYLDIEKAEAQAREAQIEAALESVRASSMSMHHSNELENVVKTLALKFTELGLSLDGALILFFDKKTRDISLWIATNQLPDPIKVEIPNSKTIQSNLIVQDLWAAFETGKGFMNKSYSGKIKNDYFHFTVKNNRSKIPKPIRKFQQEAKSWTFSAVAGKNSVLGVDSWYERFITQQDFLVLKRFSNVFEQSYTRFLDLQKAEAQARKSQIQLALERVRARTMAMHRSDELREVVKILYDQIGQLGFSNRAANIALMNPDTGDTEWWMSGFGKDEFPDSYFVKYFNNPDLNEMLHRWKNGDKYASFRLAGESKKNFDQAFLFGSDFKRAPEEVRLKMAALDYVVFSLAYMKYGALNLGHQAINEEQAEILQQFAIVFEQTYTRFLDLQKAEAQAREAQIEAALEKCEAVLWQCTKAMS